PFQAETPLRVGLSLAFSGHPAFPAEEHLDPGRRLLALAQEPAGDRDARRELDRQRLLLVPTNRDKRGKLLVAGAEEEFAGPAWIQSFHEERVALQSLEAFERTLQAVHADPGEGLAIR